MPITFILYLRYRFLGLHLVLVTNPAQLLLTSWWSTGSTICKLVQLKHLYIGEVKTQLTAANSLVDWYKMLMFLILLLSMKQSKTSFISETVIVSEISYNGLLNIEPSKPNKVEQTVSCLPTEVRDDLRVDLQSSLTDDGGGHRVWSVCLFTFLLFNFFRLSSDEKGQYLDFLRLF